MIYLNLGCGSKYSNDKSWVNIDFNPRKKGVKKVNILKGLPFDSNSVDAVFSSNMLEHFTRDQGEKHIRECARVLKKGGIIRIVVPDLENVCREYLRILDHVKNDDSYREKYEYVHIELIDQMVRSFAGGDMVKYWEKPTADLEYVKQRTGFPEDWAIYKNNPHYQRINRLYQLKQKMVVRMGKLVKYFDAGKYAYSGELHKWMYDSYTLTNLLENNGFDAIEIMKCNESRIDSWTDFGIEINNDGTEYKPSCLYVEGVLK